MIIINIRRTSITFVWAGTPPGEQDLDLTGSFSLLLLRGSSVSVLERGQVSLSGGGCWRCGLQSLLQDWTLVRWRRGWLSLHVNSTENSSPEGDSVNTACPSSDLTMVSPPCPISTAHEDHWGHCTTESRLKKGCMEEWKSTNYYLLTRINQTFNMNRKLFVPFYWGQGRVPLGGKVDWHNCS